MFTTNKSDINVRVENHTEKIGTAHLKNSFAYDPNNTGNGTITGVNGTTRTATETWTLTCIKEETDSGIFSVVGSVSGQKDNATVGDEYNNGQVTFTINDGSTDWAKGDIITVDLVRDFTEPISTKPISTVQAVTTGDLTTCKMFLKGSLNNMEYANTDIFELSSDEITNGYVVGSNSLVVSRSHIYFDTIDITDEATVVVYGK